MIEYVLEEGLMPPWFAEAMIEGVAQAQALWLERGGHMLLETRGDDLVPRLLDFLGANVAPTT